MIDGLCLILCWNVHGLNTSACREAVCELASAAKAGILCLQETKLHHIGAALARDIAALLDLGHRVSIHASGLTFTLSSVYGLADDALKPDFLQEMKELTPTLGEPWLIVGDFNHIYEACDKNNTNLCRRLMGSPPPSSSSRRHRQPVLAI
ncbi:hypothetical protein BRADI_1g36435v3 [Brachypodium distachyon]|uniref:Endonuclease/exonuclease/phosphatase domain-containing protein n=1 Tax=Brachypodium distachyon TaxID=15368 RepID=A0A2K2DN07_BRADI|nr:hypothetical protein BRADI_1g36435v3 [Brachypodium distachyon]